MNRRTFPAFLLASSLLNLPATAQETKADELPPAAQILDAHVAATGGKPAHLAIKTRKMSGKLVIDMFGHKFDAKVEKHAEAPAKAHMLIESLPLNQILASDGKHVWEWRRLHDEDVTTLISGVKKDKELERTLFHGEVHWRHLFKEVETLRVVQVEDKPAYQVRVATRSGDQYSRFYDLESKRLVKHDRSARGIDGKDMATEVYLSEYQEFDGVWLAMNVRTEIDHPEYGKGTQTWIYASIEHGIDIPQQLFVMPEELAEEAAAEAAKADKKGNER